MGRWGNFFLQTALNLLQERRVGLSLELTVISPENWQPETSSPDTLYIFDRYLPAQLPLDHSQQFTFEGVDLAEIRAKGS